MTLFREYNKTTLNRAIVPIKEAHSQLICLKTQLNRCIKIFYVIQPTFFLRYQIHTSNCGNSVGQTGSVVICCSKNLLPPSNNKLTIKKNILLPFRCQVLPLFLYQESILIQVVSEYKINYPKPLEDRKLFFKHLSR